MTKKVLKSTTPLAAGLQKGLNHQGWHFRQAYPNPIKLPCTHTVTDAIRVVTYAPTPLSNE